MSKPDLHPSFPPSLPIRLALHPHPSLPAVHLSAVVSSMENESFIFLICCFMYSFAPERPPLFFFIQEPMSALIRLMVDIKAVEPRFNCLHVFPSYTLCLACVSSPHKLNPFTISSAPHPAATKSPHTSLCGMASLQQILIGHQCYTGQRFFDPVRVSYLFRLPHANSQWLSSQSAPAVLVVCVTGQADRFRQPLWQGPRNKPRPRPQVSTLIPSCWCS